MEFTIEETALHGFPAIKLADREFGSSARLLMMGSNLFSWELPTRDGGSIELIDRDPAFPKPGTRPVGSGFPILAPFPNRVQHGKYTWAGRTYELTCNEANGQNAIHGFAADSTWRVVDKGSKVPERFRQQSVPVFSDVANAAWVTTEFQMSADRAADLTRWPGDFRIQLTTMLAKQNLLSVFEITNLTTVELPFGLGTHAYYRFPISGSTGEANCAIKVPARSIVPLEACLPIGAPVPVPPEKDLRNGISWHGRQIDDIYTDLEHTLAADNTSLVRHTLSEWSATPKDRPTDKHRGEPRVQMTLEHSPEFKHAVIYIPPHRRSICIEPYTCLTNAINAPERDAIWHLPPGAQRCLWMTHSVSGTLFC